jgi:hypothetical protein
VGRCRRCRRRRSCTRCFAAPVPGTLHPHQRALLRPRHQRPVPLLIVRVPVNWLMVKLKPLKWTQIKATYTMHLYSICFFLLTSLNNKKPETRGRRRRPSRMAPARTSTETAPTATTTGTYRHGRRTTKLEHGEGDLASLFG